MAVRRPRGTAPFAAPEWSRSARPRWAEAEVVRRSRGVDRALRRTNADGAVEVRAQVGRHVWRELVQEQDEVPAFEIVEKRDGRHQERLGGRRASEEASRGARHVAFEEATCAAMQTDRRANVRIAQIEQRLDADVDAV